MTRPERRLLHWQGEFADPQVRARDMVVEVEHPVAGPTRLVGIPVKLSETPGAVCRPAPTLGQHTAEVLGELGLEEGPSGPSAPR